MSPIDLDAADDLGGFDLDAELAELLAFSPSDFVPLDGAALLTFLASRPPIPAPLLLIEPGDGWDFDQAAAESRAAHALALADYLGRRLRAAGYCRSLGDAPRAAVPEDPVEDLIDTLAAAPHGPTVAGAMPAAA